MVMLNSRITKAPALLNCTSSTSFVMERLGRRLQLPLQRQHVQVTGICDPEHTLSARFKVKLKIADRKSADVKRLSGPRWKVEAAVHPKLTIKSLALPVSINRNWRDLSGLHLADPEFGVHGNIDVFLGVDMFSQLVRQGQLQGCSFMALDICFGWVFFGTVWYNNHRN